MQGLGHLCELWNEPSIIPCKPQKISDLSDISKGRSFLDGFYFTLIGGYSLEKEQYVPSRLSANGTAHTWRV